MNYRWAFALVLTVSLAGPGLAETADELFADVLVLHSSLDTENPDPEAVRAIRVLLDRIIDEDPDSDLAFRILLQREIEGLDVAALDRMLATAPATSIAIPVIRADPEPADEAVDIDRSENTPVEVGTPLDPAPTDRGSEASTGSLVSDTATADEPRPGTEDLSGLIGLTAQAEVAYLQALAAPAALPTSTAKRVSN